MKRLALALLVSTVISPALAAGPIGPPIKIGNWNGGVYTNDATGQISSCTMGAPYLDGTFFAVSVYLNNTWALGFSNPRWQLRLGEGFPVDFTFDGKDQFHLVGKAISNNFVAVMMPYNSAMIERFKRSSGVAALAKGEAFQFALTDTSKIMPALTDCVARVRGGGTAVAGNLGKSVTLPATGGGSLNPNPAPAAAPSSGSELEIEAIQIASNFLIGSAMHGARVLTKAETPVSYVTNDASWRSDDAYGFVRILPDQHGVKGIDVAASITASDAKECKGKFASGRTSELVNSDVMFRGFSTCEDSKGTRVSQYFVVPRDKGGFVIIAIGAGSATQESKNLQTETHVSDLRQVAWTAAH
jgi:hypothetical protein